ncbi:hypothetical protein Tco_0681659 [Tanacetum coccineum]|uniref:Uncharacterized protein n=1 Tax=Tanacetum coccineum TaxID=301880 RepID=A0ABQ4XP40_9ASTR
MTSTNSSTATLPFLQYILDLYFKYFKLSEDVVNRILQVILDLQHFKSSLLIFAATILQISSAIHHLSNNDNMYIKSYSFSLFSSLPGVLTPVRGESLKILNGFDVSLPVSHSLWSSQSFGHQKAINGFDMPLPVAVCSGLVNPLAPRKDISSRLKHILPTFRHPLPNSRESTQTPPPTTIDLRTPAISDSVFNPETCPQSNSSLVNFTTQFVMVQKQIRGVFSIINDCSFKVSQFDMLSSSGIMFIGWCAYGCDYENLTSGFVISDHSLKL